MYALLTLLAPLGGGGGPPPPRPRACVLAGSCVCVCARVRKLWRRTQRRTNHTAPHGQTYARTHNARRERCASAAPVEELDRINSRLVAQDGARLARGAHVREHDERARLVRPLWWRRVSCMCACLVVCGWVCGRVLLGVLCLCKARRAACVWRRGRACPCACAPSRAWRAPGTVLYVARDTKPSVPSLPMMRCLMISMGSSAGKSTSALSE
jgi:hypothetical protein